ncbi:hypothetical protein ACOJIV_13690 [Haloarcula sp. AONF1]
MTGRSSSTLAEIERAEPSDVASHERVVVDLMHTVVPAADFQALRSPLPESEDEENWRELFSIVDAGGWGETEEAQPGGGPRQSTAAPQ